MRDDDSCNVERDNGSHEANADRASELSLDTTLEILSQRERRYILSYLADSSENVATLDELVEGIFRAKTNRGDEAPTRDTIKSSLYHIHLPTLTDAGVVEYDARSQQLRYWADERLERWLERIQREEEEP